MMTKEQPDPDPIGVCFFFMVEKKAASLGSGPFCEAMCGVMLLRGAKNSTFLPLHNTTLKKGVFFQGRFLFRAWLKNKQRL